ncbi:hypothetical protein EVAR_17852_1 [Eumeta japonica]|uniref:Uncharacterized protein n=1 Tax=Eumeta variegata TaxID=151549 RepID=A0A4C1TTM2_EUMVA|nr:hypothetical protein EVAR_17852_1 [Eumeta japonica]
MYHRHGCFEPLGTQHYAADWAISGPRTVSRGHGRGRGRGRGRRSPAPSVMVSHRSRYTTSHTAELITLRIVLFYFGVESLTRFGRGVRGFLTRTVRTAR